MLEDLVAPVALIGLIAVTIWLNERLSRLEREHRALLTFVLSNPGAVEPAATPTMPPPVTETESMSAPEPSLLDAVAPMPSPEPPPALEPVPAAAVAPPRPTSSAAPESRPASRPQGMETALGTKWAVWVGGVALALGGIFLVRYTIESGFFGPGVRLIMAGIFGLLLIGAGEFVRRSGFKVPVPDTASAFVPAILTAAGSFTLFATIYSAHAVYGFVGSTVAFTLLGLVGLMTMGFALVHGQLLGGLGLLGSLLTPILVSSQAPNFWALYGYLAIVLVSTTGVARLRRWVFLATAAFAGTSLWALFYLFSGSYLDFSIVVFINAVLLATLAVLWLGNLIGDPWPADPKIDAPSIAVAILMGILTLALFNDTDLQAAGGIYRATVLVVAMLGVAIWRSAALPLVFGAGVALLMTYLYSPLSGTLSVNVAGETLTVDGLPYQPPVDTFRLLGWLFVALYMAAGAWKARALVTIQRRRSALWAFWGAAVPVVVTGALWLNFGNLDRDVLYAFAMLVVVALLVAVSEWVARAEEPPVAGGAAVSILLTGAAIGTLAMLHMAFGSLLTTITIGVAAAIPVLATRVRRYTVLGWLSLGAVIAVMVRAGIDPTIVGGLNLGRTPVFNALLPGYGIPAAAFAFAAWQLARTTDGRPRLAMEASAILFAMLTVAMLVRHAMNGGVITSFDYTLGEQAIYTILSLGAGAILISLDMRSPSPVMRYGSIGFGILSVAMTVLAHFLTLNPLFTEEATGQVPFFNLLLLAYFLPAVAAGGLAFYARGKRPYWYSAMLGLLAALLAFAYATLSVRRWFQGEYIGLWRGMTQLETYTYSAVWLLIGVGVLVVGVLLRSQILRVASGVLIAAAVAKVFLVDMSELEGVLRALSFIGLGAVLIGIGLFYQKLLTRTASQDAATPPPGADAPQASPR